MLAGVFEGLEPLEIDADDENEIDEVIVTVEDAVCEDVTVPLPVGEPVPLTDALIVDVDESVPLSEPDKEGPAPLVTLAVGERDTDFETEVVEVGVCDAVLVPLPVDEPVPLTDELIVDVVDSVPLSELVNDGPAPFVTLAVGE